MSADTSSDRSDLSLDAEEQINRICLAFEEILKSGEAPAIERHLGGTQGVERARLLRELVGLEIDYRGRKGERPNPEEYHRRFPDDRQAIDGAFQCDTVSGQLPDPDAKGQIGGAASEPPPVSTPDRIGPYKILEFLGGGGMGNVFLAEQEEPVRRRVALKVIKLGMDTREVVARFEAERQALALMDHPGIAKVHDAGTTADGRPYFVMEYVPGIPITEHCDRHRLSIRERLDLFIQVCEAVQHAHQKAVIHRDLKPSNVLVSFLDGKAVSKIIDFGIAKATNQRLTEKSYFTVHGMLIGTPAYMSPEQADLTSQDIDTRTDIYSLGVLLYELLVGVLPFDPRALDEAGCAEIQRIIREEDPPKPSTRLGSLAGDSTTAAATKRHTHLRHLLRELQGDLDWITMKALEKDRTRRYATARDLAEDLRRHLNDDPVLAGPPSGLYRLRKFVRKHPGRVAAALAAALFAAILWGQSWYFREKERSQALRDGANLLAEFRRAWDSYLQIDSELRKSERELREAEGRSEPWQPVWEREEEIEKRDGLLETKGSLEKSYNLALSRLLAAQRIAPAGTAEQAEAQEGLAKLFFANYEKALEDGQVAFTPAFFETMVRSQKVQRYEELVTAWQRISLQSDPPGAAVYCFRYESREERLVPLPFAPGSPGRRDGILVGKPFLLVEKVWDPDQRTFQAGDRILNVNGQEVSLHGDLAKVLKEVKEGEKVQVSVRRDGKEMGLSWIPFPAKDADREEKESPYRPGRVVDIYDQFGFTLAGYPLDFVDACRIGATGGPAPVELELPRGSYLIVFKKVGFLEARLPAAVPSRQSSVTVRLFPQAEVPEGYIHIPAGGFPCGGDLLAFEGLDGGFENPGDFFMSRTEVTAAEYLRFIQDQEVSSRIDAEGRAVPRVDWTAEVLRDLRPPDPQQPVQFVPILSAKDKTLLFARDGGTGSWRLQKDRHAQVPIYGMSLLAGVEYADWMSRRFSRWRFRLPKDLEWEKAARGADRRFHVWGDNLIRSFCNSLHSSAGTRGIGFLSDPVCVFPFDESVYGIRDLAGSMSEPVLARAKQSLRSYVVRGGSWESEDFRDLRAATRNWRLPEKDHRDLGLRLVADPAPQKR